MPELNYTNEELNNYRKGNYTVMTLIPMKFLKDKKISVKEYAKFIGNILAITWQKHKEAQLSAKAKLIAMNYAATGAENISFEEQDNNLTITIGNWPHPGFLQALGMTKEMVNDFNFVFEPIADFLGMKFTFEITETGYILNFAK
ncbi:MAG: hypothetical protein FK731_02710 [Asgard group archaeon]|nr:hypothetical protein [Asgard group archaeon]